MLQAVTCVLHPSQAVDSGKKMNGIKENYPRLASVMKLSGPEASDSVVEVCATLMQEMLHALQRFLSKQSELRHQSQVARNILVRGRWAQHAER